MPQSWFKPNGHRLEQRLHFSRMCHNRAITMALAAVANNEDYNAFAPRKKSSHFIPETAKATRRLRLPSSGPGGRGPEPGGGARGRGPGQGPVQPVPGCPGLPAAGRDPGPRRGPGLGAPPAPPPRPRPGPGALPGGTPALRSRFGSSQSATVTIPSLWLLCISLHGGSCGAHAPRGICGADHRSRS